MTTKLEIGVERPCGNPKCGCSSGIHEGLTFGSGDLDQWGFWEHPCAVCARAHEAKYPNEGECWPFKAGGGGSW